MALLSQQFLGPTFSDLSRAGVHQHMTITQYFAQDECDDETERTLPIGFVASASEAKEKDIRKLEKEGKGNRMTFDCSVCMSEIDVPVAECLEEWMRLRLVCPICRGLPPL